jgi:hypothetical protein
MEGDRMPSRHRSAVGAVAPAIILIAGVAVPSVPAAAAPPTASAADQLSRVIVAYDDADAAADPMTAGDVLGRGRSAVQLGHALDLEVVAEGVEDEQTLNHLRLEGCNLVQGYFISKPLPADEFADWLAARVPLLGQA